MICNQRDPMADPGVTAGVPRKSELHEQRGLVTVAGVTCSVFSATGAVIRACFIAAEPSHGGNIQRGHRKLPIRIAPFAPFYYAAQFKIRPAMVMKLRFLPSLPSSPSSRLSRDAWVMKPAPQHRFLDCFYFTELSVIYVCSHASLLTCLQVYK